MAKAIGHGLTLDGLSLNFEDQPKIDLIDRIGFDPGCEEGDFTATVQLDSFFPMQNDCTITFPLTERQLKRKRRSERRNKKRPGGTRKAKRIQYKPVREGYELQGLTTVGATTVAGAELIALDS